LRDIRQAPYPQFIKTEGAQLVYHARNVGGPIDNRDNPGKRAVGFEEGRNTRPTQSFQRGVRVSRYGEGTHLEAVDAPVVCRRHGAVDSYILGKAGKNKSKNPKNAKKVSFHYCSPPVF
jgi:hypothetical protein